MRRLPAYMLAAVAVAVSGPLLVALSAAPSTSTAAAAPAGEAAPAEMHYAIRAGKIYPVTPETPGALPGGVLIVRAGKIEAVGGADFPLPPDLPVIDLRDAVICPGFVSAASSLAGRHAGPDSVSASYRALDAFDPYEDQSRPLARGTTTVHLDPGAHRLVSGVGAVVKLGAAADRYVLREDGDVCVALGVFNPPPLVQPPFYGSSDVPIEPARGQRPESRLGQLAELRARLAAVAAAGAPDARSPEKYDDHAATLAAAWRAGLPWRMEVRNATDILAALEFVAYLHSYGKQQAVRLVGLTEGAAVAAQLAGTGLPLLVRIEADYQRPGANLGPDPEGMEPRLDVAAALVAADPRAAARLALAGKERDPAEDLRKCAQLAVRGGLSKEIALAAITRVPAEMLALGHRVGSLAPGRDADFLVLTGEPLETGTHVLQTYVNGRLVWSEPRPQGSAQTRDADRRQARGPDTAERPALVVRAGTIWTGETALHGGAAGRVEVLIEDGKIGAVGLRVPHPPYARVIDAGPGGFITPGFIDAHGHLGLQGDATPATPDTPLHKTIATAGREFQRVARAGVTTVLLSPYRNAPNGARMAAIKTYGAGRDELVTRELSGVKFTLRGQDPLTGAENLRKVLRAGQKYAESWKKYEEELAKWKEGGAKPAEAKPEETKTETGRPDPITGKWEFTVSGGPLPSPVTGTCTLKLTGTSIEGRLSDPMSGEEAELTGTLNGEQVTLEIDVETPMGKPTIQATLDREDHLTGKVGIAEISINFEATRTDKSPVEFRVHVKRKKSKDGRPEPPKVDENLEPLRPLFAGRIPAVVEVETAAQIAAAVRLFVEEFKTALVLVGADKAADAAEPLTKARENVGVVLGTEVLTRRENRPYNAAADLSRRGLRVALQSNGEDAARSLPLMALHAADEGLGGDAALRALTADAARMYKLDDRVGLLAEGKDADVLVFSGHPFDADSRLERVIVGGREVPDDE